MFVFTVQGDYLWLCGFIQSSPPTNEKNPLFSIIIVIIEYHYSSELFSYVFKLGFNLVLTWVSSSLFLDLIFKLRINLIWYQLGNVSTCNKNYTGVISYNEWRYPWSRIVIFFSLWRCHRRQIPNKKLEKQNFEFETISIKGNNIKNVED